MTEGADGVDGDLAPGEASGEGDRWCSGCQDRLPLSAFYRRRSGPRAGKPFGPCIECKKQDRRDRDRASKQRIRDLEAALQTLSALVGVDAGGGEVALHRA